MTSITIATGCTKYRQWSMCGAMPVVDLHHAIVPTVSRYAFDLTPLFDQGSRFLPGCSFFAQRIASFTAACTPFSKASPAKNFVICADINCFAQAAFCQNDYPVTNRMQLHRHYLLHGRKALKTSSKPRTYWGSKTLFAGWYANHRMSPAISLSDLRKMGKVAKEVTIQAVSPNATETCLYGTQSLEKSWRKDVSTLKRNYRLNNQVARVFEG